MSMVSHLDGFTLALGAVRALKATENQECPHRQDFF